MHHEYGRLTVATAGLLYMIFDAKALISIDTFAGGDNSRQKSAISDHAETSTFRSNGYFYV